MHYWRNWRCRDEAGLTNGATRPPLEDDAVGYAEPAALIDKSWSRPLNDGYPEGFSEPAADLPSKDFNYWRWIKWWKYGTPDQNFNPSSPGMGRPVFVDQRELAKREYLPQPSRPYYIGAEGMIDWGGLVMVACTCYANGIPQHEQLFVANAMYFAQEGGGQRVEVRVTSPTPHNYAGKTIKCVVNGSTYELPVGHVGRTPKTLDTFADVVSFTFLEQSSV